MEQAGELALACWTSDPEGDDSAASSQGGRHEHEAGQLELERTARSDTPLSLLVFDVDCLKRVNNLHGHAAGDATLRGTAAACGEILRRSDLLGRIDGDEFAVLLSETPLDSAIRLAERLCAQIAGRSWAYGADSAVSVTVSVGCAEAAGDERIEAVLERADVALLRAKRGGNRPWRPRSRPRRR